MAVSQRPRRPRPELPPQATNRPRPTARPGQPNVGSQARRFGMPGGPGGFTGLGGATIPGEQSAGFTNLPSGQMVMAGAPDTGEPRYSLTNPESDMGFMTRAAGAQDPFGLYESSYPTPMMPESPGWQALKEQLPGTDKPYMTGRTQGQRAVSELASEIPMIGGLAERGVGAAQVLGNIGEQQSATEATASLAGPAGERAGLAYVPDFAYKSAQQDWANDPTAANAFLGGATGGAMGTRTADPGMIGGLVAEGAGKAAGFAGIPGLASIVSRLVRGGASALNMEDPNVASGAQVMGESIGMKGPQHGFASAESFMRDQPRSAQDIFQGAYDDWQIGKYGYGNPVNRANFLADLAKRTAAEPGRVETTGATPSPRDVNVNTNTTGPMDPWAGGYTPTPDTAPIPYASYGSTTGGAPTAAYDYGSMEGIGNLSPLNPNFGSLSNPITSFYQSQLPPAPTFNFSNWGSGNWHKGGMVHGNPGEEVPGTLLAGEMVMSPDATRRFGPMLEKMNRMGFAKLG